MSVWSSHKINWSVQFFPSSLRLRKLYDFAIPIVILWFRMYRRHDLDHYIPRVKKSLSAYIGNIGEKLGLRYLIENGFEVISFTGCLSVLEFSRRRQEDLLKTIEAVKLRENEESLRYWKEELRQEERWEKAVKKLVWKEMDGFFTVL